MPLRQRLLLGLLLVVAVSPASVAGPEVRSTVL